MSACKGCGKEITWAKTRDGKTIPLDGRPPIYRMWTEGTPDILCEIDPTRAVTHFATCPKANDFSGSKKK